MRNNAYIVWAIFLLIVLVVYFGWFYNSSKSNQNKSNNSMSVSDMLDNAANWQNYDGEVLAINYPDAMKLIDQWDSTKTINLSLIGPTQREATEFYDGLVINIAETPYSAPGITLKDAAEMQASDAQNYGEVIAPVDEAQLGGQSGYVYEFAGAAHFKNYFLPLAQDSYLVVTLSVADPGNLGFSELADAVLKTFSVKVS